jgi:hypothetical protein
MQEYQEVQGCVRALPPCETSLNTAPSLKNAAGFPCATPVNRPEVGWAGIEATVPAEGHAS